MVANLGSQHCWFRNSFAQLGKNDEQNIDFRRKVMEKDDDRFAEDLATVQKNPEIAASKVAHHTKAERENKTEYAGGLSDYVRKLLPDARKRSRGKCSRNRPGKTGPSTM